MTSNSLHKHIALHVDRLSKRYGARVALGNVSFDVQPGECVVFTGANGAGKTTLLRCLASTVRPTSGEVLCFGRPVTDPPVRQLFGVVAHESLLYPQLSLRENLVFAARMYGASEPGPRAEALLEQTGLQAHAARRPAQVSRGMRQRAAVARALVHQPRILLLDETFSNLDAQAAAWLLHLLAERHAQGQTLCLAMHDQAQSRALADRIFELRGGSVWEEDRTATMTSKAA